MGDQRKGGQIGTPTSGADVPTSLSGSGLLDAMERRKYGPRFGVLLHRKGRWGQELVLSSLDRNGESYKRMNGVGKGSSCKGGGGSLLPLLFSGSSLEDTVTSWRDMELETGLV